MISLAIISAPTALDRLGKAFSPDYGSLLGAENVRIEAWVTPPDYTGRAPIFLEDTTEELRVPAGSIITVRAQAPSAPRLRLQSETRETVRFEATPDGAYEATTKLIADADVSLHRLCESVMKPHSSEVVAILIEGPDVMLAALRTPSRGLNLAGALVIGLLFVVARGPRRSAGTLLVFDVSRSKQATPKYRASSS